MSQIKHTLIAALMTVGLVSTAQAELVAKDDPRVILDHQVMDDALVLTYRQRSIDKFIRDLNVAPFSHDDMGYLQKYEFKDSRCFFELSTTNDGQVLSVRTLINKDLCGRTSLVIQAVENYRTYLTSIGETESPDTNQPHH